MANANANVKFHGTKKVWVNENQQKDLGVYSISGVQEEVKAEVPHITLVADLSYSMTWAMRHLQEMVKAWPRGLSDTTYVSVVVYSGHGDSRRIIGPVRADEVSLKMAKFDEVIEANLHPIGITVMSEPLELTLESIKAAADVCDFHGVVMFTDGCLVPSLWSREQEAKKCYAVAEACAKNGIALNAIGFGHYYDREFLKQLVETANTGILTHAEDVHGLAGQINDISFGLSDAIRCDIPVVVGEGTRIIIPNLGVVTSSNVQINSLPKDGNIVIGVISDGGQVPQFGDIVVENAEEVQSYFDVVQLSLALEYAKSQDMDQAEFLVRQLGDTALADSLESGYTFKESGESIARIQDAILKDDLRFVAGRHPAEAPKPEGLCLVDILDIIVNGEDNKLLWAVNTPYNVISRRKKEIESNVEFIRDEEAIVNIDTLVIASDKLNIGIKVSVPGKATDKVSGASIDCVAFRDRTLVSDGNLNVPHITAQLDKATVALFKENGVLPAKTRAIKDRVYKIPMNGIKLINKSYSRRLTAQEIANKLFEIKVLKTEQYALNKVIKNIGETLGGNVMPEELSPTEARLRELLHVDFKGVYSPEGVEDDNSKAVETYVATFVDWDVAKFPDAKMKEKALADLEARVPSLGRAQEAYEVLVKEVTQLRKKLRKLEMEVSFVRIASTISRRSPFVWDTEEVKPKKSTSKVTGNNLVVGGEVRKRTAQVGNHQVVESNWAQIVEV